MGNPAQNHAGAAMPELPVVCGNYAVVVAHPDDEVLWFSSVLEGARRIIFCYGDYAPLPSMGAARRRVMEDFPHPHVEFLDLPEGLFHECADWKNPRPVPAGMAIADRGVRRRYEENFALLVPRLEPLLRDVDLVFTHNPWGEYGHEDHVQVHQAIRRILSRRRGRMMMPAYFTAKSSRMREKTAACADPEPFALRVDKARARAIKELYESHGCWTYIKDWLPPDEDSFLLLRDERAR